MAYRIRRRDHGCEKAMRRIAQEQIGKAILAIDDGSSLAETVHDVRKRCKKMRGLIHLVRSAFADHGAENAAFREIAGLLSSSRDAHVTLDCFDALAVDAGRRFPAKRLATFRSELEQAFASEIAGESDMAVQLVRCRELLEAARLRSRKWTLDADDWDAIEGGLKKTCSRAHAAADTVRRHPDVVAWHELRRHIKYHWYHTRLLEKIAPSAMRQRARMARKLTETIGTHHDLAVFSDRVTATGATADRELAELLAILSRRRRAMLESKAQEMVSKLLAPSPGELVADWHTRWKRWQG